MSSILYAINVLLPLLYCGSFAFFIYYFNTLRKSARIPALALLVAGIILHAAHLTARGIYYRHFPITNISEAMSMIAFDMAIIYLIIDRAKHEGKTGLFFLAIVFLFQLVSSMFMTDIGGSELLENPMFSIHVIVTLLGISGLAIAALYGFMYWMLAREIKGHRLGMIYRGMPPLESLEEMGLMALQLGIVVMGLGILLGHLWAYQILGKIFMLDAQIIISDLIWLMYAVGWLVLKKKRLAGLHISLFSLGAFLISFSVILVIRLFISTFHKFM